MTFKQITNFLETKFPKKNAEKWDNVGLLFGNKIQTVKKVVVALDLTKKVFDFAIKSQSQLIITHHPFLFFETIEEDYKKAPYKQDLVRRIGNTDMGLYVIHTNFDSSPKGMANILVKELGFKKYSSIFKTKYGKMVETTLSPMELIKKFKEKFNFSVIHSNVNKEIAYTKIAIFPGSASIEDIIIAKKQGAGLVITSDVKWSDWITAEELNIKIMQIPHVVEDVFTNYLSNFLQKKFKNIEFLFVSSNEISKIKN